ncbi:MAG TPA: RDD family protein [Candidatus Sulfopaludibacter sp.]|nr:RDD family protein [Candidatus Sulfopaludibacter sp.]
MAPETRFCSECGRVTPADELAQFGDRLICAYCKQAYAQKLREGVTPVAAATYAGFWIRVVAVIIDAIVTGVLQGLVWAAVGAPVWSRRFEPGMRPEEFFGPLMGVIGTGWLIGAAVNACYEALFVSKLGATPGKMALGLKVVRPDGRLLDLGRSFGRHFAKILSGLILCIGFIMVGFDSEKRGLHDMICDSRVVRVRN